MEATQKQKGFIKSKLAKSFTRVTQRTSQSHCSSKVTPSPPPTTQNGLNQSSLQRVSYASSKPAAQTIQNGLNQPSLQRLSYASSKPAASTTFFYPDGYVNDAGGKGSVNAAWGCYGGDENVDAKAESYISYVRDRFKIV